MHGPADVVDAPRRFLARLAAFEQLSNLFSRLCQSKNWGNQAQAGLRQLNGINFDLYSGESAKLEYNSIIQSLGNARIPGIVYLCVRMGSAI
jgi:hypothetical protein